jgi:hypothetical protein
MAGYSGQDTGLAERAGLVTAASEEAVLINKPLGAKHEPTCVWTVEACLVRGYRRRCKHENYP